MKTSIILPTYCRPAQLRRCVERLLYTVSGLDTEIIVVAEVHPESLVTLRGLPVETYFHEDWRGSVANWNMGAAMATGDLFVTGADDLVWGEDWLRYALAHLDMTGTCYVGLNDLMWNGWNHDPTHWLITRQGIVDYCGGCLMPPCYKTTYPDNEIAARIKRAGQYTWCREAVVEHMHYSIGKSQQDRCYLTMSQHYPEDRLMYEQRAALGFPDSWEPVVFAEARHAPGG